MSDVLHTFIEQTLPCLLADQKVSTQQAQEALGVIALVSTILNPSIDLHASLRDNLEKILSGAFDGRKPALLTVQSMRNYLKDKFESNPALQRLKTSMSAFGDSGIF